MELLLILLFVNFSNHILVVEAAIPTSVEASLLVDNENSDMHLGYKSNITVRVAVPAGTTTGATISIMASTTKLVMALGNTRVVSAGGNIASLSTMYIYSVLGSTLESGFYTIIGGNMTLQSVYNTGSSTNYDDSVVTIQTDVYVNSVDSVTDGEQHAVMFKLYDGGTEVWSRDVMFTMQTTILSTLKAPEINTSFPATSDLERGTMARIYVDLLMPWPSPDIVVTVSSGGPEVRVFRLSVTEVGENYDFFMKLEKFEVEGTLCEDGVIGNDALELVFPIHLANLEAFSQSPVSSRDLIRLQALVYMDLNSVLGDSYTVNFVIKVNNNNLWSSLFKLKSTAFVNLPVVTKMKKLPSSNGVAVGGKFYRDVNLTLPEFGVFKINVTIQSLVAGGQGKAGVMMEKIEIVTSAINIKCYSVNVYFSNTGKSKVQNKAVAVIQVTNIGAQLPSPGEDRNWVVLRTRAVPLPGYTEVGDAHSLDFSSGPINATEQVDVDSVVTFDQNLVYTLDFYHGEEFPCISPNQTFEFFFNITTERGKTPGSLLVKFPGEETVFSVHEYRIIHIGENLLPCFQTIQLDGSLDQYTVYSDGSLGNITMEFPLFCNEMSSSDVSADQLTVRVVAGARADKEIMTSSSESFTVHVTSSGLLEDVMSSLDIVIQQTTVFDTPSITYGIEIQKTDFDVGQFATSCIAEYSEEGFNYHTTRLQFESENVTHVTYTLEDKPVGLHFRLKQNSDRNATCCVQHRFLTKNLKGGIEVFSDVGGLITSKMIALLDGKNETCIPLPVQGQSPPILWIRLNTSTVWELGLSAFQFSVLGHGLICSMHNHDTVLKVLYPSSQPLRSFHGDVTYCNLNEENVATPGDFSLCSFNCPCVGPQCAEVFLFMATSDSLRNWTICEISASN